MKKLGLLLTFVAMAFGPYAYAFAADDQTCPEGQTFDQNTEACIPAPAEPTPTPPAPPADSGDDSMGNGMDNQDGSGN